MVANLAAILAPELEIRQIFLCLTCQIAHRLVLCFILSTGFAFLKQVEKHAFSLKIVRPQKILIRTIS